MALTMLDKHPETSDRSAWPPEIAAEFERETKNPNPCVGNAFDKLYAHGATLVFGETTELTGGEHLVAARCRTPQVREQYRAVWNAGLTGGCNYYRASPLRPPTGADDPVLKVEFAPAEHSFEVPMGAIEQGTPFPVPEADVLATLAAFEAALASMKSGLPVVCQNA